MTPQPDRPIRVAIAHDYLTQRGGAERVVLAISRAFPDAPIYTTLYDPEGTYPEFRERRIVVTGLNRFSFFRQNHRATLPLLPGTVSSQLIEADVLIASTSGWAHGFQTTGAKLVYCHSPARWLYLTDEYFGRPAMMSLAGMGLLAMRPSLKAWDRRAALTGDKYWANSRIVQRRIQQAYGIEAELFPPPHGMDASLPQEPVEQLSAWADGYHLVVSRLLPYKNVHVVTQAFRELPQHRLVVIGHGPMESELRQSLPPNARLLSGLSDEQMRWAYAHCSALIAPSFEDFGLTPLEAAAFGKPTLALRGGGYLDTVEGDATGLFFEQTTPQAIRDAVASNSGRIWDAPAIRAHADTFSEFRFRERLRVAVTRFGSLARAAR